MFRKILTASAFSLVVFPLAGMAHEKILTFEPEDGQSNDELVADMRACEEKVVEDGIEEPHPLYEEDPLERRSARNPRPAPSGAGIGVGTSAGGVDVGTSVGGTPRVGGTRAARNDADWALKDAEHLNRHNAYEVAMTACMQEKGYKE